MKQIRNILSAILVAPIIAVAFVISLSIFLVMRIKELISCRIFRKREAGSVFLVCTSRHNWHEFIKNNVIPVLPENFRVVWVKPVLDGKYSKIITHLDFGISKPYMVVVTPKALLHHSLNIEFRELKKYQGISDEARKACFEILKQTENKLQINVEPT